MMPCSRSIRSVLSDRPTTPVILSAVHGTNPTRERQAVYTDEDLSFEPVVDQNALDLIFPYDKGQTGRRQGHYDRRRSLS